MAQTTGFNLPPPQTPFVDPKTGILDWTGYQYLLSILAAAANSQTTASVAEGLEATGNNQATALQITSEWNEVDSVPNGTGVLLSVMPPGQSQTVFNGDPAQALLVYPPPGVQIDALGENEPYSLAHGTRLAFETWSATQIRS